MRTSAALVATVLASTVGLPAIALSQEAQASTPVATSQFDALIADLAAGNRQAALDHISTVLHSGGGPWLVSNRAQFVDRVLNCPGRIASQRVLHRSPVIDVAWQCADGTITATLSSFQSPRYIEVRDVADEAERTRRGLGGFLIDEDLPQPPLRMLPRTQEELDAANERTRRVNAERAQILAAFGSAVQAASLESVAENVTPEGRITYGYSDPFNSVEIHDLQGEGIAALREQVAAAVAQLGVPIGHSCEQFPDSFCRWTFADANRSLLANVFFMGGNRIIRVQMLYVTPRSVAMNAQKATPEQIEAFNASQQAGGAN
ncbi:MAG: hypothetical protein ABIT10_06230 [Alteraurantiacibacter sp.]